MIRQSNFFIPPEIEQGLLSGDLTRYGGVVRNPAGRIVKHLKELDLPADAHNEAISAVKALKNPRVVAGAIVAGAALLAAGAIAAVKKRRGVPAAVPKCIANYNASLSAYLEAAHEARLDAGIIGRLIADLDAVLAYSGEDGNLALDFSTKQAGLLVRFVIDSTRQLAEDNAIDMSQLGGPESASEDNVVDLRGYLEVQRRIFSDAA